MTDFRAQSSASGPWSHTPLAVGDLRGAFLWPPQLGSELKSLARCGKLENRQTALFWLPSSSPLIRSPASLEFSSWNAV